VRLEIDGFDAYDLEPAELPDLFGERPLIVMGKYRGAPRGTIRILGKNAQGPLEQTLRLDGYRASDDLIALRHLWARERIALSIDNQIITRLGMEHQLMTMYTSFVAIDSLVRNTGAKPATVEQPLPSPEGLAGVLGGLRGHGMGSGGGGIAGLGGTGGKVARDIHIERGQPFIMGSLDRDVIRRVIKGRLPGVRRCYETQLLKVPNLSGKIGVRFTIGGDGLVTQVEVSTNTMASAEVQACVVAQVKALRFPKPIGGGVVIVSYPFIFKTH
jgi:Ca-activated chloride channel homolog